MPDILQILGILTFSLAAIVYILGTKTKQFFIEERVDDNGIKGYVIIEITYYLNRSLVYTEYAEDEDNILPFLDIKEAEKVLKRLKKGKTKFKINKL